MRTAEIYMHGWLAGWLSETERGYEFIYDELYLSDPMHQPISKTLPLQAKPFTSTVMFPFFDGLIPEGWLLNIAERNFKLNGRDRMGLLLACCEDCIGAVSVKPLIRLQDEK
ncbi:HipA N-terminal domain-containing protein [Chitinophaga sp.]|uniref:HipA N-terminal domain-containing protein n=1 Tax=Chitinophaga sp. TaxID=1869181 RepID=UPI0031DE9246